MLIIDGIFGAGLSRAPEGIALLVIEHINSLRESFGAQVISIDIPSGLSLEAQRPLGACIKADYTCTFAHFKRAHVSEPTKKYVGRTEVIDIGLFHNNKPSNFWLDPERSSLTSLLKTVFDTFHKGDFGHVAVLEGHANFLGASRLSARAALRVGAGLLTLVTDKAESFHASDLSEYIKRPLRQCDEYFWSKISCLVLGPGLSHEKHCQNRAKEALNKALSSVNTLVLDAGALSLALEPKLFLERNTLILTPHPKEAAMLLNTNVSQIEQDRFKAIERLADLPINHFTNTIWVLKGATTLLRQKQHGTVAINGNAPILAVGGSGDVLSGAIAGLIAQSTFPFAACMLALSLQVLAAKSFPHNFRGLLPSELADSFPSLCLKFRS